MAKFCRFCGSPLEEGQVCTCQGAQAANEAPVATAETPAAAPAVGNELVASLKATLLGYWKSPRAAAAAAADDKNGMAVAGIFVGVNFLAMFFFLWRIIGMLMSTITGVGELTDLMDYLEIKQPIFPMLLAGLVIAVLGVAVTALTIFAVAKINKQPVDLKKQLLMAAVHSVVPTALLIVGIVLGLLAAWLQFLALALILVLWFVNVCSEVRDTAGVQVMETGKSMTVYTLVIFAVLAIGVYLMVAVGGWGIGELSIQGMTLNALADQAGGLLDMISGLF